MGSEIQAAEADRRADMRTLVLVALLAALSLSVSALLRVAEVGSARWAEAWLLEGTSHAVIVGLAGVFPPLLDRVEVEWDRLWRAVAVVAGLWAAFTMVHVGLTHFLRLTLFPQVVGRDYELTTFDAVMLAQEALRDLFILLLIGGGFVLGRMAEQAKADDQERLEIARTQRKIALVTAVESRLVDVGDIRWARGEANCAEVRTASGQMFVRMTLGALERELAAAGGKQVRIHRCFIVDPGVVTSVAPAEDGGAVVTLATGEKLPGSWDYREALTAMAKGRG